MRDQIAIVLALTEDLVSPPRGGKYYRFADAILPLIEEAVTAERERCVKVLYQWHGSHLDSIAAAIRGGGND